MIWRRGLDATLVVALVVAATAAEGQTNDACTGAIPVAVPSTTIGSNVGATTTAGLPVCPSSEFEVWYVVQAPYNGTLSASTCSPLTNFVTVINVKQWSGGAGTCGAASAAQHIICDSNTCSPGSLASFSVVAGQSYFIAVGSAIGTTGTFELTIAGAAGPPSNDGCSSAIPVALGATVTGSNLGALTGPDPVGNCVPPSHANADVWFSFVAPFCGAFAVTTCGSITDTVVTVWQGSCGSLSQIACNDDACTLPATPRASTATFTGVAGNTYRISVASWCFWCLGDYSLTISAVSSPPVPMALAFMNSGPGTIGYSVASGPPGGTAFTAFTLAPGSFPAGWFYGLDIELSALFSQWNLGFPFVLSVPTNGCPATAGPFGPLPPGLTVYGVTVAAPSGSILVPTSATPPASGSVP